MWQESTLLVAEKLWVTDIPKIINGQFHIQSRESPLNKSSGGNSTNMLKLNTNFLQVQESGHKTTYVAEIYHIPFCHISTSNSKTYSARTDSN